MPENKDSVVGYLAGVVILLFAVGVVLYYALYVLRLVPIDETVFVEIVVAAAVGYASIRLVSKKLLSVVTKLAGPKKGAAAYSAFKYVSYVILVLVILGLSGVSGTALLAGGAFAGLVIGLAGQTVLSNVLAGFMLLISRPFEVGDRITILTSQYSVNIPLYQPKFYSDDYLIPGLRGTVQEIGLSHTTIKLDDGTTMKMPNNSVVQAAIVIRSESPRVVRVRYQVTSKVDPEGVIGAVEEALKKNGWVEDPATVKVYVESATNEGFLLVMEALCKEGGGFEAPRSSMLMDVRRILQKLASA